MTAALCQMFFGGALLAFAVWLKLYDVRHMLQMCTARSPVKDWIEIPTPIVLSRLGVALILDPLIPGVAGLAIRAVLRLSCSIRSLAGSIGFYSIPAEGAPTVRATYQGLPEHLRVRV
jgi:hypothetical protein